jgi:hypothetical protein
VCARLRCLRTHVGRHVPHLDRDMVIVGTFVGYVDNDTLRWCSMEGIMAQSQNVIDGRRT